ncbi:MAG: 3-oxoacyl-(acyl-carrier-protein) synthase 2 [Fibrobacteria bacterium]|jgi:3-oxoacyl-[acyl-carrier-protein] synthase II|nr:3-oxoacyl-(acyl-carrier-protein) synthase 2 [Fibrobacteria bacterium]
MNKRVVITGIGAVTPLGLSVGEYWANLAEGKSGVRANDRFDVSTSPSQIAGLVPAFDHVPLFKDQKMARRLDKAIIYGVVAGNQAVADSGLLDGPHDLERVGVYLGSGMGGVGTFEAETEVKAARGHKRVTPFFVPMILPNTASGYLSIEHGFMGPNYTAVSACASANHAMGEAFHAIQRGDAEVIFAGGTEAAVVEVVVAGFANMKALSGRNDDPEGASRPWDKGRDGFVIAEGAAVLCLEEMEHAKKRGAKIYGEFAGFGQSSDGYHITAPHPEGKGGALAMAAALRSAKLNPEDIDLVNAHGTSTPLGDIGETMGVKKCFGEHAKKLMMHSTKSMIGHTLGAAGAVEAVAALLALDKGVVHPTRNLHEADPQCDLDYVPGQAREAKVRAVLSNSFGFGGHNSTVILKKFVG